MPARCLFYYITDRTALGPDEPTRRRRLLEKISEAAHAGVDYIQLREKDLSTRDLESLAHDSVTLLNQLRTDHQPLPTALLINHRTDIALATGSDGVHLRSTDIAPNDVREIWQASCGRGPLARAIPHDPIIAVSCHSFAEAAQAAAQTATFAVFAPVFGKKGNADSQPTGLAALREACTANIPVLALGSITLSNARTCLAAGAAGIAAIRLFQENNIAEIVRTLR